MLALADLSEAAKEDRLTRFAGGAGGDGVPGLRPSKQFGSRRPERLHEWHISVGTRERNR
jgi:hypothetical protein